MPDVPHADDVAYLAYHDPVTGLANRAALLRRLGDAVAEAGAGGRAVALLYVDLDDFKLVNDGLGHPAAHEVLRLVAERVHAGGRAGHPLPRRREALGVEALVRWRQADGTLLTPDRFIGLSERTGLVGMLGEQVLESVCRQVAAWEAQGLTPKVGINVSPLQLRRPDFAERFA